MHLNYTLGKKEKKLNFSLICFSGFQVTIICQMDSPAGVSRSNMIKIHKETGLTNKKLF